MDTQIKKCIKKKAVKRNHDVLHLTTRDGNRDTNTDTDKRGTGFS